MFLHSIFPTSGIKVDGLGNDRLNASARGGVYQCGRGLGIQV